MRKCVQCPKSNSGAKEIWNREKSRMQNAQNVECKKSSKNSICEKKKGKKERKKSVERFRSRHMVFASYAISIRIYCYGGV